MAKTITRLKSFLGGLKVRDVANAMAAWTFQNGPLETCALEQILSLELLEDDQLGLYACPQLAELLELNVNDPKEIKS